MLAEEYDRLFKEPGKKNGPLGMVAVQILKYMINRIRHKTGQLDPSLQTIMTATGRCKDAVCK
ncbi:MAG TPA: replication protein A, partial [Agrobacterium sp.]|nr:replication protein A [Agrobacterium sp.]